ncbi:amidohydrolase family protein [Legionella dresdenensis]|uniref:Amidohydrolase family protein n=1 Tax=Legionella dresdenensis TaxID=450200 RepID=A0ABV8CD76_9GAMM
MKIALEEHFVNPGLLDYCIRYMPKVSDQKRKELVSRLSDFHQLRLAIMDESGIDFAVLGLSGPGVQAEADTKTAIRLAQESNDILAGEIARNPDRFGGFAHLAMQSAEAAADELERTVTELGFAGAMVNGHTNGVYLDAPQYDMFWERMQALNVPLYLHPTDAYIKPHVFEGCDELLKATWEWNCETSSHFLRLIYAGVFDRFPQLKIILGHMGEMLPFELWRLDSRSQLICGKRPLKMQPSDYLKRNLYITTSGQCDDAPLKCSLQSLGDNHVLFSADYPYEDCVYAANWIDKADISEDIRAKICYKNALAIMPTLAANPCFDQVQSAQHN